MKKTIRLTESELTQIVRDCINESLENGELDEGFFDFMKGAGKMIGNKAANVGRGVANAGRNVARGVANAGRNMARGASNMANKAGQSIRQNYDDVMRAGHAASMQGDNQKIANKLQQWLENGVFGNSRQAASYIQGLINAMEQNYQTQYGE